MTCKRGLGKGLDSLIVNKIDHNANEKQNVSRETLININKIEPNKGQPRSQFDEDSLHELADSIKLHGIIQPLIVHMVDDHYEIIAGERRWRAARIAGMKEVPVIIKEYTNQQVLEIALIENIQREDLNAIEEAKAYDKLIHDYNLKQDEVAERVGKSRVTVTNSLRLIKLDPRVQQMVIDDMISGGHARAILGLTDKNEQYKIAQKIFDEKLSVRETEKLIKHMQKDSKAPTKEKVDSSHDYIYKELEEKMKSVFGSKVEIRRQTNSKGKIEIQYYSQEDLDRIIDLVNSIN